MRLTISTQRSARFGQRSLSWATRHFLVVSVKPWFIWPTSSSPTLGVRPEVCFVGPVDNMVPPHVADHILAVLREAVTNAAKHAQAGSFSVEISVIDDDVRLLMIDDGAGFEVESASSTGHGMTNMRNRAEKLGGTFAVTSSPGQGTQLVWVVPV